MPPLPLILLGLPLFSAAIIGLLLRERQQNTFAALVSTLSALLCLAAGIAFLRAPDGLEVLPLKWIDFGKDLQINLGFTVDRLSRGMMFIVVFIGALVHVFSLAYMKDDESKGRYFGGLSLFMFSMTGIVLADNFIMMFIFWELVGVSSWMLIGHWFQKDSAADASKKAFLINRIGDFGFMIGILILWGLTGAIGFEEIRERLDAHPGATPGLLTAAVLCVFCGAVGKSAQAPLHTWLPDAMEGPTPVSALIHAATMVAAGVYMLARTSFLLESTADDGASFLIFHFTAPGVITWVGAITSLLAALMAMQQDDIKRVLAYSTLSQLGYMVMVVGLLHGSDQGATGMFHLYTHAFFKALLFLGAGAIIYACHHEQNIWKMGGLLKKMPITGGAILVGTAALIAVPFTSGFFSKEEILTAAWHHSFPLFVITALVAFCTAFYMARLLVVVLFGQARDEHSEDAKEVGPLMFVPLVLLALFALISAYPFVRDHLQAFAPEYHGHPLIVTLVSLATCFGGAAVGWLVYRGRESDPLSIPLFRNKFYIDEIYAKLVGIFQDGLAWFMNGLDRLLIDGALVGGLTALTAGIGSTFRRLQTGNLRHYGLLLGGGVALLVYLIVFFL